MKTNKREEDLAEAKRVNKGRVLTAVLLGNYWDANVREKESGSNAVMHLGFVKI